MIGETEDERADRIEREVQAERTRANQEFSDVRSLMDRPEFRRFARVMIGRLHVETRGELTAFGQGRRDAGFEFVEILQTNAPELWAQMMREHVDAISEKLAFEINSSSSA